MSKSYAAAPASPRAALLVAALAIWAVQRLLPMGRLVLYPFTLLATWVHEMGHGVTALLVGGRFLRLDIYADASGLATSSAPPGIRQAVVAAGGLLAPPLVGALLLLLGRRAARPLLLGLSVAMMLSPALWVRTPIGWLTVGGLALLCALCGRFLDAGGRLFFVQLLGLLLALDTVTRADYLFMGSAAVGGQMRPSDVSAIASATFGPPALWGGIIAGLSAALLLLGLWSVLRRPAAPRRRAVDDDSLGRLPRGL
jgi:hypothetical protein